jgi:hypothetical protein
MNSQVSPTAASYKPSANLEGLTSLPTEGITDHSFPPGGTETSVRGGSGREGRTGSGREKQAMHPSRWEGNQGNDENRALAREGLLGDPSSQQRSSATRVPDFFRPVSLPLQGPHGSKRNEMKTAAPKEGK